MGCSRELYLGALSSGRQTSTKQCSKRSTRDGRISHDTGVGLAAGDRRERCGCCSREKGRVTGASIDLVLLSGHCVLDPLRDRMTVFGFVLARDKPDQHQLCRFLIVFPLGTRHPSIFFFFSDGDIRRKSGFGASSSAFRLHCFRPRRRGVETKHDWALWFYL